MPSPTLRKRLQSPGLLVAPGGNVPLVYTAVAGALTHVQAGKLKAIAVSSGKRSPSRPERSDLAKYAPVVKAAGIRAQ